MTKEQRRHRRGKDEDRDHEEDGNDNNGHGKEITIVVNAREKTVTKGELNEDDLVKLAFETPPTGKFICFTITYRRGQGSKPEGTLEEGESVRVKEGMIFNVTATDKS